MSLVNNMLRGLELRREAAGSDAFDPLLEELSAVDQEELRPRKRALNLEAWAALLILLFVPLVFIFAVDPQKSPTVPASETVRHGDTAGESGKGSTKSAKPVVGISSESMNIQAGAKKLSGAGVFLKLDPFMDLPAGETLIKSNYQAPIDVDRISMDGKGNDMKLSLALPAKAKYLMYTLENPYRMVLELANSRYDGALPDINDLEGIRAVRHRRESDGTYKLVLESEREVLIDKAEMKPRGGGYVLWIDMVYAPATAPVAAAGTGFDRQAATRSEHAGSFSKSPAGEGGGSANGREISKTASRADVLVYQGRKLYENGKIRTGIGKLIEAVEQEPEHTGARKTLAVLLLEQDRPAEAKELLVEGLHLHPGQPEWARVLARILYDEGSLQRARAVLEGAAPPLRTNLDYHALYAGILQAMEDHARAAIVYRNLLKYGGSNGAWWLGLAISLEAMARNSDAAVAYRNALNTPEIKADSEQFIKNRLRNLEQQS